MINPNELIFCVDENNNPIEPVGRKLAHEIGVWHRVAEIVVYNSQNEILCHKRSMLKDSRPGNWDIPFGGHALAGMDMLEAAITELREESGIVANPEDLKFIGLSKKANNNGKNNQFYYPYTYHWDGDEKSMNLEKEEVDEVKWIPVTQLYQEVCVSGDKKWSEPPYMKELLTQMYERSRS